MFSIIFVFVYVRLVDKQIESLLFYSTIESYVAMD
jgi:hypothetical protein